MDQKFNFWDLCLIVSNNQGESAQKNLELQGFSNLLKNKKFEIQKKAKTVDIGFVSCLS